MGRFSFLLRGLNAFTVESRVQSPGGASGAWSPESLLSGRAPTPGSPQTSSSSLRTRPLVPCRRLPAPLEIGRSSKIQAYFLDLDMMKF